MATTGADVLLIATKAGTSPLPAAPNPIDMLLLVQLYTVPGTGPPTTTAEVDVPLHTTWLDIAFTLGVGFTVIVKLCGGPVHVTPPSVSDGVIVINATTGAVPALVAIKPGILPVPIPARPIDGCVLVHKKIVPTDGPNKASGDIAVPLHTTWLLSTVLSTGVGLTAIVNVVGAPVHVTPPLLNVGVTTIVATTWPVVLLIAVKLAILPTPVAAKPIDGVLLVQLYTVPGTKPENVTAVVGAPLHTVWLATAFTVGVGFTVYVNVIAGPRQVTPPKVALGVTVINAITGAFVTLVAVKAGILPTPLSANPMLGVLLIQLYTAVPIEPLKLTAVVVAPLHTTWLATAFTVGVGFTVIVTVVVGPLQLIPPNTALGVTTIVAVTGALVPLTAVNTGILPTPLLAKPIPGVLFDQLYVVPATPLLNVTPVVEVPLHTVCDGNDATTFGVGFTVIVNVVAAPEQLTRLLV